MAESVQAVQERVQREAASIEAILSEVRRVIVGQKYLLDRMAIGLLARGHLLALGAAGAEPGLEEAVGAVLLPASPVEAAITLDRMVRARR